MVLSTAIAMVDHQMAKEFVGAPTGELTDVLAGDLAAELTGDLSGVVQLDGSTRSRVATGSTSIAHASVSGAGCFDSGSSGLSRKSDPNLGSNSN